MESLYYQGARGGQYVIENGRKVYVKKRKTVTTQETKPATKKPCPKKAKVLHLGPEGGKYVKRKGKKVYCAPRPNQKMSWAADTAVQDVVPVKPAVKKKRVTFEEKFLESTVSLPPRRLAKQKANAQRQIQKLKNFDWSKDVLFLDKYQVVPKKLAAGDYANIYIACQGKFKENCDVVAKRISFAAKDPDNLMGFHKEVFFGNLLQNSKLVPHIFDAWESAEGGTIIFERMDSSMDRLAETRLKAFQKTHRTKHEFSILTKWEITELATLAKLLGELGIVHGDLKLDNFLYRGYEKKQHYQILINDLGFAGNWKRTQSARVYTSDGQEIKLTSREVVPQFGWLRRHQKKTDNGDVPRRPKKISPKDWAVYINLAQLELDLIRLNVIIQGENGHYNIFSGFGMIPEIVRQRVRQSCPGIKDYTQDHFTATKKAMRALKMNATDFVEINGFHR